MGPRALDPRCYCCRSLRCCWQARTASPGAGRCGDRRRSTQQAPTRRGVRRAAPDGDLLDDGTWAGTKFGIQSTGAVLIPAAMGTSASERPRASESPVAELGHALDQILGGSLCAGADSVTSQVEAVPAVANTPPGRAGHRGRGRLLGAAGRSASGTCFGNRQYSTTSPSSRRSTDFGGNMCTSAAGTSRSSACTRPATATRARDGPARSRPSPARTVRVRPNDGDRSA